MAELKNTADLKDMVENYQSGTSDTGEGLSFNDDPQRLGSKQNPQTAGGVNLIGGMMRGVNAIPSYNENLLGKAAEAGWGQSRFDKKFGFQEGKDLEDLRAREQSWAGKITNGLLKGGVTTLTTAANSVAGLAYGLGKGIFSFLGDTFTGEDDRINNAITAGVNNGVSEFLLSVQTGMEDILPNYYTEEERSEEYQDQWYKPSHWVSGNYIGDQFIKNFGFTVGAMGGGMAWNKIIGSAFASKLSSDLMRGAVVAGAEGDAQTAAQLRQAAQAIQQSRNVGGVNMETVMQNIKNAGRTIRTAELTTQLLGAATAAMGEGTTEGLMARDEFMESFLPKMNQDYATAYQKLEDDLYSEHPEWFVQAWDQDESGNPVQKNVLVSEEGKQELFNRQLELSQNFQKLQDYAERQGDLLAKTTFLLNLPILMTSNLIQFGRMFGGGWTTARRNAPGVRGTFGNYTSTVNSVAGKAALGSLKVAASEGAEEMLQGMASSGAKNIAEHRLTYFNDMGFDPDAMEKASDGFQWMVQGAKDYIGDAKNWNEGFIGALTGLLGMPSSRLKTWGGGIIGEVQQAKAEKAASQAAADKLNSLVNSEEFQNQWRGYIRHLAYDDQMLRAVQNNDTYAWHTADGNQLINDVLMFADAGKLEDLYEFIEQQSSINPNDKKAINEIRSFLRSTNTADNIALANEADEKIVERVKEQAKKMKDTVDSYRQTFEDLASVAPADVNSEKFKEMMFTTMQLHDFENRFQSTLEGVISSLEPLFRAGAVRKKDGSVETDLDKIEKNLKTVKEEFRQAMAGNIKTSFMDYMSEHELNAWLDSTVESLTEQKKKLTGNASSEAQKAIDAINDMRKMAEDRRALLRKIVSLRRMSNEEYRAQSRTPESVVEQAGQEQTTQETKDFKSVDDVRAEVFKRSSGKDRTSYINSLKKIRGNNKAIDEYFKIQELREEYKRMNSQSAPLSSVTSAVVERFVDKMFDNGKSVNDILEMKEELLPTADEVLQSMSSMVTMLGKPSAGVMEKLMNDALQHVTEIINDIRKARKLTAIARVPKENIAGDVDPITAAFGPQSESAPTGVDDPPAASSASRTPTKPKGKTESGYSERKVTITDKKGNEKEATISRVVTKEKDLPYGVKEESVESLTPQSIVNVTDKFRVDKGVLSLSEDYAGEEELYTDGVDWVSVTAVRRSVDDKGNTTYTHTLKVRFKENAKYSNGNPTELEVKLKLTTDHVLSDMFFPEDNHAGGLSGLGLSFEPEDTSELEPPVITAPTGVVVTPNEGRNHKEMAADEAGASMRSEDTDKGSAEGGKQEYYNTAVPEISPRSRVAAVNAVDNKDYQELATLHLEMLPEEREEYKDTWNWLKDCGAFEVLDSLRPGDSVFFTIDPSMPEYKGEPQILLCSGTEGNLRVFNILRQNAEWKGLSELRADILKEYEAYKQGNNDGTGFVYSKHSTVWAKRPGFITFNASDTAINKKPGYSANAPIIAIGKHGEVIPVRGRVNQDVLSKFMARLTEGAEHSKYIGNLYYLANGRDNSFIPIRLNVEHYTPETVNNTGYAFDQINACFDKIVDMAHKFAKNPKQYDKDAKDKILRELDKYLDIHGMGISFGLVADRVPVVRLYYFKDNYENGVYSLSSNSNLFGQIYVDEFTTDTLKEFFSTISTSSDSEGNTKVGRSLNVSLDGSAESNKHIQEMVNNGLITSNADSMRALGADAYFEPYNSDAGEFEKGRASESTDTKEPPVVSQGTKVEPGQAAPTVEPFGDIDMEYYNRALEFIKGKDTIPSGDLQRYLGVGYAKLGRIFDKLEADGVVGPKPKNGPRQVLKSNSRGPVTADKFKFSQLSQSQKTIIESYGLSPEEFDSLPLSDQEGLLLCS